MSHDEVELKLTTEDFSTEHLVVRRLRAAERMNVPYLIEVELIAVNDQAPALADLVGATIEVTLCRAGSVDRPFGGVVRRVSEHHERNDEGGLSFTLEVVPHFWLAKLVETLDVHLEMSLPEVIEAKLALIDLHPGSGYDLALLGNYPKREMMVQYRETDLAFIDRWCEHHGIFYYFVPEPGGATLVFGDHAGAYRPIADDHSVSFSPRGDDVGIYELAAEQGVVPRMYVIRDYNDQAPAVDIQADHVLETGFGGGIVEYGPDLDTNDQAKELAAIRAEERECRRVVFKGKSNDTRFAAGHTVSLENHPRHDGDLLLIEVEHEAAQNVPGWDDVDVAYKNGFVAISASHCFRPLRATPIPRVHGLVAGIVETVQGDIRRDALLDDQGRYTVRFLFDTSAPGERKASCPVRMMQPHAGPGYGMHFPLKPGVEVAIAFLDGNPDRPLIAGSVPNPITGSPVTASTSTKNRIKTRSGILLEFEDASRGT